MLNIFLPQFKNINNVKYQNHWMGELYSVWIISQKTCYKRKKSCCWISNGNCDDDDERR